MSHTVTSKLNKDARQHPNASGVTFFVSLGEQNYSFKTKQKEWTNYEAALFAKDGQIAFYQQVLVAGAVISVSGTGILVVPNEEYGPKLEIQDAKLIGNWDGQAAPQQQAQQAPQQQPQQMQQQPVQAQPQPQQGGFQNAPHPQHQQPEPQQQNQQAQQQRSQQPIQDEFSKIPF